MPLSMYDTHVVNVLQCGFCKMEARFCISFWNPNYQMSDVLHDYTDASEAEGSVLHLCKLQNHCCSITSGEFRELVRDPKDLLHCKERVISRNKLDLFTGRLQSFRFWPWSAWRRLDGWIVVVVVVVPAMKRYKGILHLKAVSPG